MLITPKMPTYEGRLLSQLQQQSTLCYKRGTKTSKTEITKKKRKKENEEITKKTFVPFNLNVRLLKLESLRLTGCKTEHPAYR